jgi:acid phosphatase
VRRYLVAIVRWLIYLDWPYCNAARHLSSVVMTSLDGSKWDDLKWRRRLETFGPDGRPMVVPGVGDKGGGIWYEQRITVS